MKVYFSHGKESGPRGTKIKRLAAMAETMGCAVDSVDYTDLMDPDLRVERLLEVLAEESGSFILVGSSMGGYVSLVASESVNPKAVFLMAPALYMPGYERREYRSRCSHADMVLSGAIQQAGSRVIVSIACWLPDQSGKLTRQVGCHLQ